MGQYFNLQLATDTLALDAQYLGVTPRQLQQIDVKAKAELTQYPKPQLQLTFYVQLPNTSLAAQLNWPAWRQSEVAFTDYLWEQTCLECFIAGSIVEDTATHQTTAYIEVNASPSGRYALYQFDSYRQPTCLPPKPLLQTNKKELAYINWGDVGVHDDNIHDDNGYDHLVTDPMLPLLPFLKLHPYPTLPATLITDLSRYTFVPYYRYKCSFSIPLDQLPSNLFINNSEPFSSSDIGAIHPCAILQFSNTVLYFASNHASPPDFHQRQYWTRFNY